MTNLPNPTYPFPSIDVDLSQHVLTLNYAGVPIGNVTVDRSRDGDLYGVLVLEETRGADGESMESYLRDVSMREGACFKLVSFVVREDTRRAQHAIQEREANASTA